jgi:hypothetical protein
VGIFGNDRNQPAQIPDDLAAQQTYIDGVMAPHMTNDDPAMQRSVNDLMSQSPPTNSPQGGNYSMMRNPPSPADQPAPNNPAPAAPQNNNDPGEPVPDDLVSIRQHALQQLSPLVSHLNQSPEEKFHTTMMMLQATDDQRLVKAAYEAALTITDDRTRAQALLDVINEINYFTQARQSQGEN